MSYLCSYLQIKICFGKKAVLWMSYTIFTTKYKLNYKEIKYMVRQSEYPRKLIKVEQNRHCSVH